MRRRTYLTACAGGSAGLAGCSGIFDRSGGSGSTVGDLGPAETVEAYWEAVAAGNVEEANGYIHPEAELSEMSQSRVDELVAADLSVENATVVERDDGVATATAGVTGSSGDRRTTVEPTYELRTSDGAWRLYAEPLDESKSADPPGVGWDIEERVGDDGRTTAVAFTHSGGDAVEIANLRVAVGDTVIGSEEGGQLQTSETVVARFTAGDAGYDDGTPVALRWIDPEEDVTLTLAEPELERATAGELGVAFRVE